MLVRIYVHWVKQTLDDARIERSQLTHQESIAEVIYSEQIAIAEISAVVGAYRSMTSVVGFIQRPRWRHDDVTHFIKPTLIRRIDAIKLVYMQR